MLGYTQAPCHVKRATANYNHRVQLLMFCPLLILSGVRYCRSRYAQRAHNKLSCTEHSCVRQLLSFAATEILYTRRLSYCRDSAGRRSLRRSKSFKVTDFGTNRKPVYDYLLMNSTNAHPISHRLPDRTLLIKLSLLTGGAFLTNLFSETPENITIAPYL